jgi:hypothetical protein
LQGGLFLPTYQCAIATAAIKRPHLLQFCGKAALTSRCRADTNRALLRQAVNFAASEMAVRHIQR